MATNLATKTPGQIINEMPVGVFTTLTKIKPTGALQARKQAAGATVFYWRYSMGSASERVKIGVYDPAAAPKSMTPTERGYSYAAAVRAAEALAIEHHEYKQDGGRPALVAAKKKERAQVEAAKTEAEHFTLKSLLIDYANHLEALGRVAHKDVRSISKVHIFEPWPEVAALPANQVNGEQINNKLKLPLSLTLRQAADGGLDKWTLDNLMRGELLAVTFASVKNHRTKHWALCTGCEGSASGRATLPDTILLLDPSASAPSFAYFNARLRLPTSGPGSRRTPPNLLIPSENSKRKPVHWLYEAAEWNAEEVRLLAAVRLQLKVAA